MPDGASTILPSSLKEKIQEQINSSDIFLYIKGTPSYPACGFSSNVCQILDHLDIEYSSFDVLEDDQIREGIKKFSNFPTIPQLYVKGQFIGGCDIVSEMFASGDLKSLLDEALEIKSENVKS